MKTNEIKEIMEIVVGGAEELKPVLRNTIKALEEYAPEILPQIERLQDYAIDSQIRMIKRLESNGFKRPDAIQVVGNMMASLRFKK